MDPRALQRSEGDQDCIFSLLTHTKQLLLVPFCDTTAGIGAEMKCDTQREGQTDVKSEIVI